MKRRGRAWVWLAWCALACSADQAADRSAEQSAVNGGAPTATTPRDGAAGEEQSAPRLVIDVREPRAFAAGHAPGAINLQLGWEQLAGRVRAYVPDTSTALDIVAQDADQLARATAVLRELGYEDVRGRSDASTQTGDASTQTGDAGTQTGTAGQQTPLSLWTVVELEAALAGTNPPVLIDVRNPDEWRTGTIEGAQLVHEDDAPRIVERLEPEREYAIICEGGYRSSQLASLLRQRGFTRVHNVIDGMHAWRATH